MVESQAQSESAWRGLCFLSVVSDFPERQVSLHVYNNSMPHSVIVRLKDAFTYLFCRAGDQSHSLMLVNCTLLCYIPCPPKKFGVTKNLSLSSFTSCHSTNSCCFPSRHFLDMETEPQISKSPSRSQIQ